MSFWRLSVVSGIKRYLTKFTQARGGHETVDAET